MPLQSCYYITSHRDLTTNRTWVERKCIKVRISQFTSRCMDCCCYRPQPIMLHNHLWLQITRPSERLGLLCPSCCQVRLGRPLQIQDLQICPLNATLRTQLVNPRKKPATRVKLKQHKKINLTKQPNK